MTWGEGPHSLLCIHPRTICDGRRRRSDLPLSCLRSDASHQRPGTLRGDTRPLWTDQPVIQSSRGEKRDECIRGFPSMVSCSCCAQAPTHSDSSLLDNPHTDTKRLRTFALVYGPVEASRRTGLYWPLSIPACNTIGHWPSRRRSPAGTVWLTVCNLFTLLVITGCTCHLSRGGAATGTCHASISFLSQVSSSIPR